jgi:low affinity Fe/Cu permease
MNWPLIILVSITALALVVFLFIQNLKDKKSLENQLNNDYRKPKETENDADAEETAK